jgi:hypothetical protein
LKRAVTAPFSIVMGVGYYYLGENFITSPTSIPRALGWAVGKSKEEVNNEK